MKKVVIVNFKTYKSGKDVLKLAKKLEKIDNQIIVGVSATDVQEIASKTKLKVFCEHVDFFEPGRNTGFVLSEAVKKVGAKGVFLNHSEHKISFEVLKKTVKRCKKMGLEICVFASGLAEALKIKKLKPNYLVVEPPALVGGNISVSSKPGYVLNISKKLDYPFLVGAGVKTGGDVLSALKDGAIGIAVSSGIVNAKNPGRVLQDLIL